MAKRQLTEKEEELYISLISAVKDKLDDLEKEKREEKKNKATMEERKAEIGTVISNMSDEIDSREVRLLEVPNSKKRIKRSKIIMSIIGVALIAGLEIFFPAELAISEAHAIIARFLLPILLGGGCAGLHFIMTDADRDLLKRNDEGWLAKNKQEYQSKIKEESEKQLEISNDISKYEERIIGIDEQRQYYNEYLDKIEAESGLEEYMVSSNESAKEPQILVKEDGRQ